MTAPALLGLGVHRPARLATNDDVTTQIDSNDEWIRARTGIITRGIAGDGESVVDMALSASEKALAASGVDASDLDLILLSSCTMPTPVPAGAPQLAYRLGATRAGAVDVNAACASFCYGLSWAADAIRHGSAKRVLVVGSERLTDWIDWTDRGVCILFGDGAGAAVVAATEGESGIGPVVWGNDGSQSSIIAVPEGERFLRMDGPAVFRWATTQLAPVALRACEAAGIAPADLAAFVPHQANARIIDIVARAIGVPTERVARDVVDAGNTSSASVPLALHRLIETGAVQSGDPVLLLAFGAGLTYAGQVVRVP